MVIGLWAEENLDKKFNLKIFCIFSKYRQFLIIFEIKNGGIRSMKKQITKLSSDNLLEVSGGFEEDTRNPWARELGAIDPESGKQEEKRDLMDENKSAKKTNNSEEA